MGRWAEVYFTSAPEKREEAVLELLHELEARNAAYEGSPPTVQNIHAAAEKTRPERESTETERNRLAFQQCPTCGYGSPVTHQFCGMCGAQLQGIAPESRMNEVRGPHIARFQPTEVPAYTEASDDYREPIEDAPQMRGYEARRDPYDLSLFQSLRDKEYGSDFDYEDSPSVRYRFYIAAVVAIVIVALAYMGWRSMQASQNTQVTPPPPAATESAPPATNQNAAPSTPSSLPKAAEPQTTPAASDAGPPVATKPAETTGQVGAAAQKGPSTPSASTQPANPQVPSDTLGQSSQGNGAEELAMAQRFLNGGNGQARDAREASKWLWKAMAKHNGSAMVVLADLFLRGDGVSKNCDQARVLLDSAALRGVAGAGQRLRNLQAFGCQ
jgi:hypothetical protein